MGIPGNQSLTAGPGDILGFFFNKPMAYDYKRLIIAGAVRAWTGKEACVVPHKQALLSDYRHVIICCYLLNIMAVMIPQPFARAFLILSIRAAAFKGDSGLGQKHVGSLAWLFCGLRMGRA